MHVHTVLVTLRDPATLDRCRAAMESMRDRIDGMVGFELVVNELDDELACDLALTTTWRDLDAYERYRIDPVHLAVREVVLGLMESAVTLDHTVGDSA